MNSRECITLFVARLCWTRPSSLAAIQNKSQYTTSSSIWEVMKFMSQTLHVCHICLHWGGARGVCLGRQSYASPMECLGVVASLGGETGRPTSPIRVPTEGVHRRPWSPPLTLRDRCCVKTDCLLILAPGDNKPQVRCSLI